MSEYKKMMFAGMATLFLIGCSTGEGKREGTSDSPQPSVGTTFDTETRTRSTTGTAAPGDTAGVNTREGHNDQTGPTGRGPDVDHPDAPAY